MKRILKAFRRAFRPTVDESPIRSSKSVRDKVARRVVKCTSTGSVRLQRGQYTSREDIDRKREQVKGYIFDERR